MVVLAAGLGIVALVANPAVSGAAGGRAVAHAAKADPWSQTGYNAAQNSYNRNFALPPHRPSSIGAGSGR
jgi:hypothetical protein